MKVSIVLPTYNQADMLPKAIESIMNQTYQDWELIIVNDGSTDGTIEYLESLKVPSTSEKFKIVHHDHNQKLPSALNTGFEFATGEYYTWVSSDSVCTPYMIEALAGALDKYPEAGMAYADFFIIDPDNHILSRVSNPNYCFRSLITINDGNAAFMYPSKIAKEIGLYDVDLNGVEDWDYWTRISEKYPFVYVPEALYYYRLHEKSMQQNLKNKIEKTVTKMYAKLFERHNQNFHFSELFPYVDINSEKDVYFSLIKFGNDLLNARVPQPGNAIKFYKGAIDRNQSNTVPWLNMSMAYAYLGHWNEAKVCLREANQRKAKGPMAKYIDQAIKACKDKDIKQMKKIPIIYHTEQESIIEEEIRHKWHYSYTLKEK